MSTGVRRLQNISYLWKCTASPCPTRKPWMILAAWAGPWCRRGSWCSSPPPRRRDARGRTPPPDPCASWPPPHAAWPTPGFVVESCVHNIRTYCVCIDLFILSSSVADPWNFGVDPDPPIHTSLTNGSESCYDLQDVNKKLFFLLINFWRYIYIVFQR